MTDKLPICKSDNWSDYIEQKYERDFGEPWSELEKRVRGRHPELFAILDHLDHFDRNDMLPKKPWWKIW